MFNRIFLLQLPYLIYYIKPMKISAKIILFIPLLFLYCTSSSVSDDPRLRLKYVNKKYMFSLQFPEKWINYMDFEKSEIIDPDINIPVIYFALPTRSRDWQPLNIPAGYAELFCVRVFTKTQWELYQEKYRGSEEFQMSDKIPGEGIKYFYLIRYSSSIPVDLYIYMKETNAVTDTFRMLR